jgi:hypothetical protein
MKPIELGLEQALDSTDNNLILEEIKECFSIDNRYILTDCYIKNRINITVLDVYDHSEYEISYELPLFNSFEIGKKEELKTIKAGLDNLIDEIANSIELWCPTVYTLRISAYLAAYKYTLVYFVDDSAGMTVKISDGVNEFEINYDLI